MPHDETRSETTQPTLDDALAERDPAAIEAALYDLDDDGQLVQTLQRLPARQLALLAEVLGDEQLGDFLGEIEPADAADILERLTTADAADVLEAMQPDEAADVAGEFAPGIVDQLLVAMEPQEAAELRDLLAYSPDTAGGRMTPAFVSVAPNLRADQAVVALRRIAEEVENVSYVYVTEGDDHLLGVLPLRNLVLTPPATPISQVMQTDVATVPVTADQEVAARLLAERNLLALPVVDENQRLLGIITADDVADILEQEATEDIERLGGSAPLAEPYLRASPTHLWRKRVGWLLALFLAEAYTGTVLRHYENEVEAVVALSFFIPLLIGTGGNVGSQVVTTIVRAMAVGDVSLRDVFKTVRKELITGIMLGVVMAAATFIRAMTLRVGVDIGLVVATTVTAIVIWAAVVGAVLPLVLQRLHVDPAVVSAPFISTLVDGTGLVIYFTIAKVILGL